jgi:putative ABC transport system permease protein
MTDVIKSISEKVKKNDLKQFKEYLEGKDGDKIKPYTNDIQYGYNLDLQIYKPETEEDIIKVSPTDIFKKMMGGGGAPSFSPMANMESEIWTEMIGNDKLLKKQYDVIAGEWPEEFNEVVLIVDDESQISDAVLYSLGVLDQKDLDDMMEKIGNGEEIKAKKEQKYSYDDFLGMNFKAVLNSDVFEKQGNKWVDRSKSEAFMKPLIKDGLDVKIVGILRQKEDIQTTAMSGSIAYKESLTKYVIDKINQSEIVKEQKDNPDTDILSNMPFDMEKYTENLTMADVKAYTATLPPEQQAQMQAMTATMPEEEVLKLFSDMMRDNAEDQASLEGNLAKFGVVDLADPDTINIYPKDYAAKDEIAAFIKAYNKKQTKAGHEEYEITYTDLMEVMMSSVTSMMNIVTYVLIAFVSISLIVSSIMIAIITYISVLERTKEIGILRSIGASKGDISRLFNAETIIEGFVAGVLGIGVTLLLNIPINMIIKQLADLSGISALPPIGGVALIALSVLLTLIAGLIPARVAAKKDPVIALRPEENYEYNISRSRRFCRGCNTLWAKSAPAHGTAFLYIFVKHHSGVVYRSDNRL